MDAIRKEWDKLMQEDEEGGIQERATQRAIKHQLNRYEHYDACSFEDQSAKNSDIGEEHGGDGVPLNGYGNLLRKIAESQQLPIFTSTAVTKIDYSDKEKNII